MMRKHSNTFAWEGQFGHKMVIAVCAEELCQMPHVLIYDENNKPLATMVMPPEVLAVLKAWGDEAEVARIQRDTAGRRSDA